MSRPATAQRISTIADYSRLQPTTSDYFDRNDLIRGTRDFGESSENERASPS